MLDVARLCELVKSRRTPRASECARPPQVGPRGSGVGCVSLLPWLEAVCPRASLSLVAPQVPHLGNSGSSVDSGELL